MAVDLTPRFRRLNSRTRSFRDFSQAGTNGPFYATQLWQSIIRALGSQVEVRRRRQHLRTYASCFTGSDAVDAVLSHLMQSVFFRSCDVSRVKAARLCQALMDAHVFEPVGGRLFGREKEMAFEDSTRSLYRFLDYDALPGSAGRTGDAENEMPEEGSRGKLKSKRGLDQMRTICNPLVVESSDRRVEKLLRTINLRPSAPSVLPPDASILSKGVVEEVWKQQALLQLLQILELPVLETILASPEKPQPHQTDPLCNHDDVIISNNFVDREVLQSLNLVQMDPWLTAATDCLEHFPDRLIVVASEQLLQEASGGVQEEEQAAAQKRILFDIIVKHYTGPQRTPLLSNHFMPIYTGILQLLVDGKAGPALAASQLYMRLVEPSVREELRSLLAFMVVAGEQEAFRLHKQTDNRALVTRTFLKAVVHSKELSRAQSELLLLFLMDNQAQLFKMPATLIKMVSKALQTLQQGKDLDSIPMFTFCENVTVQQYEEQGNKATLESLKQLIRYISLSANLPLQEKRRLIKDFEKHHPVAFLQHFSSTF